MNPRVAALFRAPANPDHAHALLSSLGEAAFLGHITEANFRRQADVLMGHMNRWQQQTAGTPHALSVSESTRVMIVNRAMTDIRFGHSAASVARQYGFENDPGMVRQLRIAEQEAFQHEEKPSPFRFNV